jgi:predicted transcriptional regulator
MKRRRYKLRRSKLETCICILETLASHGVQKITHLMQKDNVNYNVLKNILDFLVKQGAVEERLVGKNKIAYAITQHGLTLLKFFVNVNSVIYATETTLESHLLTKDKYFLG